jgi:hypothetical protein
MGESILTYNIENIRLFGPEHGWQRTMCGTISTQDLQAMLKYRPRIEHVRTIGNENWVLLRRGISAQHTCWHDGRAVCTTFFLVFSTFRFTLQFPHDYASILLILKKVLAHSQNCWMRYANLNACVLNYFLSNAMFLKWHDICSQ